MAQTTKILLLVFLAEFSLFACNAENSETLNSEDPINDVTSSGNSSTLNPSSPDTRNNDYPATAKLDGHWISNCVVSSDQGGSEREFLIVEGSFYERTMNFYNDTNCWFPADFSFISVRSDALQYTGGFVETERGAASQIVFGGRAIDFDKRRMTDEDAALFDPALYFYDFYLIDLDGRLYFGSMRTWPLDQFEQSLDSPNIFTAQ